ncbi:MAG: DUF2264 domain-containing protein [Planctomycetes bacterium]|nr:DUF2264 domain-containing protein [Planctomycetota bacterium]
MSTAPLSRPLDRTAAPYTGYTREHWIEILTRLAAGILPHVDRQTGIPALPGDPAETALAAQLVNPGGPAEALERTMMIMALYMHVTGRTTVEGFDGDIAELYRRGIATNLDHARRTTERRRRFIGTGGTISMLIAGERLYEPLDDQTKRGVNEELARFVDRGCNESNLLLFSMMPAPLLDRLGVAYNRERLDGYFDRILSMYRGDGWFIDGWNRQFDHYNYWGFQFYLHALMVYDERWRNRYAGRIREITAAHEATVPFWYGRDGGPIAKGRSLNYRFATLSGLAMAQRSGLNGMAPGQARRISSGCLKYFWEHGCQNENGLLSIGYHGSNAAVGEDYTDTGAPYWAATGLTALLLPADHPFWTAPEQPIPADTPGVKRCAVRGAQMVLKVDGDRGEARAIVGGEPFLHRSIWQAGSKYFRHAFSSSLGCALAGDLGPELAAGRTGLSADGSRWACRTWPRVVAMDERGLRDEWDAWTSLEGLTGTIVTETRILDRGEVHVFWHTDPQPRWLRVGGWAIRLGHGEDGPQEATLDGACIVRSAEMESILQPLAGSPDGSIAVERLRQRKGFRHAHLFGGWSAWPVWTSDGPVAAGVKVAVYVDAARRDGGPGVGRCPQAIRPFAE